MATTRRKPLSRERILDRGARARGRAGDRRALDAQARPVARLRGDVALQPRREQGRPARRDPRPRARRDGAARPGRRPAGDPRGGALGARGAEAAPVGGDHADDAGARPPRPARSTWKRCSARCAAPGFSPETTYHAYHVHRRAHHRLLALGVDAREDAGATSRTRAPGSTRTSRSRHSPTSTSTGCSISTRARTTT